MYRYPILTIAIVLASLVTGCEPAGSSGKTLYSYTMTEVSGNNQSVASGGNESNPIVVRVDMNELPTSGITVEWNIIEGDGSLSSNSGVTDKDGYVQTTYISGNTTTDVKILATVNFSASSEHFMGREVPPVTFTLKVLTD